MEKLLGDGIPQISVHGGNVSVHDGLHDIFGHRNHRRHRSPIQNKKIVYYQKPKKGYKDAWVGHEAFVIASGPSLTTEDIELVRLWQEQNSGKVIVTNNTFKIVPFADMLFFHDRKWWEVYKNEVNVDAVTVSHIVNDKVNKLGQPAITSFGNSGAGAIAFAIHAGCKKIYLLGLDGKKKDGKVHWHGNHVRPLGNAKSMPHWKQHFQKVSEHARKSGVEVVNMSRDTAIECFKKESLDKLGI